MNKKIKYIRMYKLYRANWYDVVYHSGRCCTYLESDMPNTVKQFVTTAPKRTERYNNVLKHHEMIYEF